MLTTTQIASHTVDESGVTQLALDLDAAMAADPEARAAYARIWGVEWAPLAPEFASVTRVVTESSQATTRVGRVRA